MPLRPARVPYRIGVDICYIPRIRGLLLAEDYKSQKYYPKERERTVPWQPRPIQQRSTAFAGIARLDARSNEILHRMSTHLNPIFVARLLRPEEIIALYGLYGKVAGSMAHNRLFEYFAGRWAAKEAIIKAASKPYAQGQKTEKKATFHDITLWNERGGKLQAALLSSSVPELNKLLDIEQDSAAPSALDDFASQVEGPYVSEGEIPASDISYPKELLKDLDGDMVEISISHEREYAIATALFCDPEPGT